MKHLQWYMAALTVLFVFGCGGSGGSSNATGSTTGTTSDLSTPRVEAIVEIQRTNLQNPNSWTSQQLLDPTNLQLKAGLIDPTVFGFQDPTNFQTGEGYVFQLAAYHSDGTRVILPASFQTLDFAGTYGNLGTNTGVFQASSQVTIKEQTILATFNGITYSGKYDVKQRQARLLGNVEEFLGSTPAGVDGVVVDFYDVNGLVDGSVTSAHDGTFRASIPQSAVMFSVDPHSLSTSIYNVFAYNTLTYAAGNADCTATLPGLTVGTQTLGAPIVLTPVAQSPSQPPTTACLGTP